MTAERGTALYSFVCKPERAMGDTRLRAKDHRVLDALAKCVDNETGAATVSQERLASLSNTRRRGVQDALTHLEALGYVTMTSRGRRERGQYMVRRYDIHYAPVEPVRNEFGTGASHRDTVTERDGVTAVDGDTSMRPAGAHRPCAHGERTAMRPAGAQQPDRQESDLQPEPDHQRAGAREGGGSAAAAADDHEGEGAHPEPSGAGSPGREGMHGGPDGEGRSLSAKPVSTDWETADQRTRTAWGQIKAHDRKHGTDLFTYLTSEAFELARQAEAEGTGRAFDILKTTAEHTRQMGGRPRGGGGRAANPLLDGARRAMRGDGGVVDAVNELNGGGQPQMRNVTPGREADAATLSDADWRHHVQTHRLTSGAQWHGPGPSPDLPSTRVPAHILREQGYAASGDPGTTPAAPAPSRKPAQRDESTIRRSRFADDQPWKRERPQQAEQPAAMAAQAVNRDRDREAAQQRANEALTTLIQQAGADAAMALDSEDFDAATEAEMQERGSAQRTLAERAKAKATEACHA